MKRRAPNLLLNPTLPGVSTDLQLPRLPYVMTSSELLEQRFWKKSTSSFENTSIVHPVKRTQNQFSKWINYLLGAVSKQTRQKALAFPSLKHLHPFERDLITLTLENNHSTRSRTNFLEHMQHLKSCYAQVHNVGKSFELKIKDDRHTTMSAILDHEEACRVAMRDVIERQATAFDRISDMLKRLRTLPTFDTQQSLVAFVGAPNVGKSSLVKALSCATPEVANYPFTTRGILLGHVDHPDTYERVQIADTPGLLNRSNRNTIEQFTLSILQHTTCHVIFVFDPTGHCGMTLANQLELRRTIRAQVPEKHWLDVVSKTDLLDSSSSSMMTSYLEDQNNVSSLTPEQQHMMHTLMDSDKTLRVSIPERSGLDTVEHWILYSRT